MISSGGAGARGSSPPRSPRWRRTAGTATARRLEPLDVVSAPIEGFEQRVRAVFAPTPDLQLLRTLPGVGWVLAGVLRLEVGDIRRFPRAAQFAAYAGTTPRVHASGGRTHYGPARGDSHRSRTWACIEAASTAYRTRSARPHRPVSRLYARIRQRKGHATAVGAVARHVAEAPSWILTKREPDPRPGGPPGVVPGGTRAECP